jgi:hypothetical protein
MVPAFARRMVFTSRRLVVGSIVPAEPKYSAATDWE